METYKSFLREQEFTYLSRLLRHTSNNLTAAAEVAGVTRLQLYRMLDRSGIVVIKTERVRRKLRNAA